eukprot:g5490.t1
MGPGNKMSKTSEERYVLFKAFFLLSPLFFSFFYQVWRPNIEEFASSKGYHCNDSTIFVHSSRDDIGLHVGAYVKRIAEEAIEKRKRFTVAISGGSLLQMLSLGLKQYDIDYSNWYVVFADERSVSSDSKESNYKAAQDILFSELSIPEAHIFPIDGSEASINGSLAARNYEQKLIALLGRTISLDLTLLGMGSDGHTCSLFPGNKVYDDSLQQMNAMFPPLPAVLSDKDCSAKRLNSELVSSVNNSPKAPTKRITLTLAALRCSRNIAFVAAGSSKAGVLPRAVLRDAEQVPASFARDRNASAHWFVDESAASLLKSTSSCKQFK